MDPQDQKENTKFLQKELEAEEEDREFSNQLRAHCHRTFRNSFVNYLKGASNVRQRKMRYQMEIQRRYRSYIGLQLPEEMTEFGIEIAEQLMPPGSKLYLQPEHKRWQAHEGGVNRCRSWGVWTYYGGFEMLAKWAWKRVLEPQGFDVLDCPVPGLFPARTGDFDRDADLINNVDVIT